ncbi:MAG TPA: copper homeostasis periplasmic binding protein CopC [Stellaceae bacterium]|jgi:hypothetical protein|nr:copper homeostasis periplasmic binding protein CopC [Stellaceae bacterium]
MRLSLALLALAAVLTPATALAHAFLDHAVPAVGSTVPAPAELRVFFTEALEPAFSAVTVATEAGQPVQTGAAKVDPGNPNELVLPLPKLAAGTYKASWHVVSVDTHRTEGHFEFTVQP